jgi:hypothetical protein
VVRHREPRLKVTHRAGVILVQRAEAGAQGDEPGERAHLIEVRQQDADALFAHGQFPAALLPAGGHLEVIQRLRVPVQQRPSRRRLLAQRVGRHLQEIADAVEVVPPVRLCRFTRGALRRRLSRVLSPPRPGRQRDGRQIQRGRVAGLLLARPRQQRVVQRRARHRRRPHDEPDGLRTVAGGRRDGRGRCRAESNE